MDLETAIGKRKPEVPVMHRKGLVRVFTGNGAGKSSAAFGLALRASGQGLKVLILQFMKQNNNIGELKALEESTLPIRLEQHGHRVFFKTRTCETKDILQPPGGWKLLKWLWRATGTT